MSGGPLRALREKLGEALRLIDEGALARTIDATLLDPSADVGRYIELVEESLRYRFASIVVPPVMIDFIVERLGRITGGERPVRVCSVAGFPSGFSPLDSKLREVALLVESGVDEIDYVITITKVIQGDIGYVDREVGEVRRLSRGVTLKVIVEAPLLSDEQLGKVIEVLASREVDFVKTSTGVYSKGGDYNTVARVHKIAKKYGLKVKAAGGIRDALSAIMAILAGAERIGTSSPGSVIRSLRLLRGAGQP